MRRFRDIAVIVAALAVVITNLFFVGFTIANNDKIDLSEIYQRLDELREKDPKVIIVEPAQPEPLDLSEFYVFN